MELAALDEGKVTCGRMATCQPGKKRDVSRRQRVSTRPKLVECLTVPEENRFLIFLCDQLRTQFDIGRTLRRNTMYETPIFGVKKINNFQSGHDYVSSKSN